MDQKVVGTPQTDEAVAFLVEVYNGYKGAAKDGKIDWADTGYLVGILGKVGPAIQGMGEIPAELKDLDSSEGQALLAKFAGVIGEVPEKAREIAMGVFKVIEGGVQIFKAVKA